MKTPDKIKTDKKISTRFDLMKPLKALNIPPSYLSLVHVRNGTFLFLKLSPWLEKKIAMETIELYLF
jgi:hypothetical protein